MAALPRAQCAVTVLARPKGVPKVGEHLGIDRAAPMPDTGGGARALVRNLFMSLDPGLRAQLDADVSRNYARPVAIGAVMRAATVGEVVVPSRGGELRAGDLVLGGGGWQEYYAAAPRQLERLDGAALAGLPPSAALGVLGGTGLTAYVGMLKLGLGAPRAGETVLVSTAAGATGSVAAQIAKHVLRCRVVGIAGGARKCAALVDELGLDAAIDYKAERDMSAAIRARCPRGVDFYFDNVGGAILNAALARMAPHGRVALSGSVSAYNGEAPPPVPSRVMRGMVTRRVRTEGFLTADYRAEFPAARAALAAWVAAGKVRSVETVVDGLHRAPAAFQGMFQGENTGKLIVRIAEWGARPRL